ncbi:FUSC family protein [Flavivirga eckloniae]|uniref:FUSC family protein n=1 Tax=Flavivirga eckloniae TaxID=1803846 RepID=A0A2K9PLM4_9FLAO|nr:FUSC family protein [Flavivirga eckloniae]AUP77952.1 FUSC family protein [Flavivirga eckloniae]
MKKTFLFLTILASILALVLSSLLIYKLAIVPSILGLIFGLLTFYLFKKRKQIKKIIQFAFMLNIMALAITTYKSIFNKIEIADAKAQETTKPKSENKKGLKNFRD